jgi:hypothetical protein
MKQFIGALYLFDVAKLTPGTRGEVAFWLRDQAELLETQGHELSNRYRATYSIPREVKLMKSAKKPMPDKKGKKGC